MKSSAYDVTAAVDWGKDETKKLKREGEMTDPCGTPVRVCLEWEMEW